MSFKDLVRDGLTCDGYFNSRIPEREISDDILRQAFFAALNGTSSQWRAFIMLLRIIREDSPRNLDKRG